MSRIPKARKEDLIVKELSDEVLIYDLKCHKAHHLDPVMAFIWKHCDEHTTVTELAKQMQQRLGKTFDADLLWIALRRLDRASLLQKPIPQAPKVNSSRREMTRKIALLGGLAVVSILAPTAASAASCVPSGGPCALVNPGACCSLTCINGAPPHCA